MPDARYDFQESADNPSRLPQLMGANFSSAIARIAAGGSPFEEGRYWSTGASLWYMSLRAGWPFSVTFSRTLRYHHLPLIRIEPFCISFLLCPSITPKRA